MGNRRTKLSLFGGLVFAICGIFIIAIAVIYNVPESVTAENFDSQDNVAKLYVSLSDVDLETLNAGTREEKYLNNSVRLVDNAEELNFENVEVKGHGNGSWSQNPKKSYRLKFSQRTSLLGLSATKKYLLVSNYRDMSHLRNDLANHIGQQVELPFVLSGEYVELYIDNNYQGLYYLTHKVEIDSNVVKLGDANGILVEADYAYAEYDSPDCLVSTTYQDPFMVVDTVSDDADEVAVAKQQFIDAYNALDQAIINQDWQAVTALIDVDSFAKYYLISEFTSNFDAYKTSFYMYKDGADDKIHAGPVWDYDLAYANTYYLGDDYFSSPTRVHELATRPMTNQIMFRLMTFSEFESITREMYRAKIAGHLSDFLQYMDARYREIWPAAMRDNEQWEQPVGLEASYLQLRQWIIEHYNFLDQYFDEKTPNNISSNPLAML